MKKMTVLLLALLLLTLPACSKNTDTDDPYLMCYGDPDAKDALHILVDFHFDDETEKTALHNFAFSLQETGGLENLVFERRPQTGAKWKDLYASVNDLRLEALVHDLDGSAEWELFSYPFLEYAVGRIADYEEEELLVTEEELKERIEEVLTLREESPLTHEIGKAPYREYMMDEGVSNKNYNVPITILPMYSDDGGVTVSVNKYAAINRNTKHPEKAYTVIDLLMREYTQLEFSYLFSLINDGGYIPLNNKALHPDHPMRGHYYLDESSLKELTDIKEQITAVNFDTDLSTDINSLLYKCEDAWERNEPIDGIVHEVYVQMQRKLRE